MKKESRTKAVARIRRLIEMVESGEVEAFYGFVVKKDGQDWGFIGAGELKREAFIAELEAEKLRVILSLPPRPYFDPPTE